MESSKKKTYNAPYIGGSPVIAAIPVLAAPLAITSLSSASAFVGGLAGGAALAAWAMSGKFVEHQQTDSLPPTDSK